MIVYNLFSSSAFWLIYVWFVFRFISRVLHHSISFSWSFSLPIFLFALVSSLANNSWLFLSSFSLLLLIFSVVNLCLKWMRPGNLHISHGITRFGIEWNFECVRWWVGLMDITLLVVFLLLMPIKTNTWLISFLPSVWSIGISNDNNNSCYYEIVWKELMCVAFNTNKETVVATRKRKRKQSEVNIWPWYECVRTGVCALHSPSSTTKWCQDILF